MAFSPQEFQITDAHTHIYPAKIAEKAAENIGRFYDLPARGHGSEEELLEMGRKYGVMRYLVCSVATVPQQVRFINEFIAGRCGERPEFFGFGAMHPDCDVAAEMAALQALGLHGLKLHPDFQRFYIDDRNAYPIYEEASARKLPILFHMGDHRYDYSSPQRLGRLLEDFPNLKVIAAHLGGYHVWDRDRDFLRRDNVWFDVSSTLPLLGAEESARQLRHMGLSRVFFGTDYPLWDYDEEMARFFTLPLSRSEFEAVLNGNFEAFLDSL